MESSISVTYIESAAMSQRKKTVIDILRDSDDFVSGEAISDVLGISRNAVHKHVKSLRSRGYRIVGVSRRGYRLEDEPCPPLHGARHGPHGEARMFGHSFRYHDEIESTNARGQVPRHQRRPRGHGRDGRGAERGSRPPGPSLDVAGRQGPPLLRHPAAVPAHERSAPADDRGGDGGGRGHREARRRLAGRTSSGPTTCSSAIARSAASSWRSPGSRTKSTGSSSASA